MLTGYGWLNWLPSPLQSLVPHRRWQVCWVSGRRRRADHPGTLLSSAQRQADVAGAGQLQASVLELGATCGQPCSKSCPRYVKVLVSSREVLGIAGESACRVPLRCQRLRPPSRGGHSLRDGRTACYRFVCAPRIHPPRKRREVKGVDTENLIPYTQRYASLLERAQLSSGQTLQ